MTRESQIEQLRAAHERLRLEFIRAELELSHTLASFAPPTHAGTTLAEVSRNAAWQGYRTAVRHLDHVPPSPARDRMKARSDDLLAILGGNSSPKPTPGDGVDAAKSGRRNGQPDPLTPRETEVLKCIAEGHSTKQVAAILGITFKTAACHRQRLMAKLGVHETVNLVRYAIRQGITRP